MKSRLSDVPPRCIISNTATLCVNSTVFSNCESTCDLQIFQLQFMIEKSGPDVLTPSTTFYDLSVTQSLPQGRNARAEPTHMKLSGTDGLSDPLFASSLKFSPFSQTFALQQSASAWRRKERPHSQISQRRLGSKRTFYQSLTKTSKLSSYIIKHSLKDNLCRTDTCQSHITLE